MTANTPPSDRPNASDAEGALYRLMSWLSPTFASKEEDFSYGLEWAVSSGEVEDLPSTQAWLEGILRHGSGRADAVLLTHAARANSAVAVAELAELATALCSSAARRRETTARGRAFYEATRAAWPCRRLQLLENVSPDALPYPIAVGVTSAGHGVRLHSARLAYLQAFSSHLTALAARRVRLGEMGQQRLLASLEPAIRHVAETAGLLPIEGLGGCSLLAEIGAMHHEQGRRASVDA